MDYRLAPAVETELDEIWYYIATESNSIAAADRLLETITQRFLLLASHPHLGRSRDHDLRVGLRSFPVGEYMIFYRVRAIGDVSILHILHGSRDLISFFGEDQ